MHLIVGLEIIFPFIQIVGVSTETSKKGTQRSDIQKANCLVFFWYLMSIYIVKNACQNP